ncbi:MAG: tetratricopeptide (TPR) repeat protein [Myxococcota bacterium]|jgi:tetratricopeptide (TPR) repeat protein
MTRRSSWLAGLLCVALVGCAMRPVIVGYAERVDGLRRQADEQLAAGKSAEAEATLERILTLPAPYRDTASVDLQRDARFALGRVLLLDKRPIEALAQADAGLALGPADTVFVANLHALRAMCLEALERPLDALMDYGNAMKIHKALFDAELRRHERG